jgi:urease accessory protein
LFSNNNVDTKHSMLETKEKIIDGQYLNLVSLLQLSDSFFPTGMYTMSNGLESFFYSKKLKNADQLIILIKNYLESQMGPLDCSALGVSYVAAQTSDLQRIINIDQTVFAMRLIEEVSHRLGIPKFNAGVMMLYSFTISMAGAALRLGILDHFQVQRIIHELRQIIIRTVEKNIDRPLTGFWQFAPEINILQMQHEKMSSKMFIT